MSLCDDISVPVNYGCDYTPQPVGSLKVKKDEQGNLLVMVNDDGKWRGAELITGEDGQKIIQFSY